MIIKSLSIGQNFAAEAGLFKAQAFLAQHYFEGKGVSTNYKQYIYWIKLVAQGDYKSEANLGLVYIQGTGVDIDYKKVFFHLIWQQMVIQ